MFAVNDKVVYPGHGVAYIAQVVEKIIGGIKTTYYELHFINKEATILVPTLNAQSVGMRHLSNEGSLPDVFNVLKQPAKVINNYNEFTASNWNKRNKRYQLQFRTGKLIELSEIYRDLRFIETQKELSFGEKNLLNQAESLLVEEISLVKNQTQEKTLEQLRSLCAQFQKSKGYSQHTV